VHTPGIGRIRTYPPVKTTRLKSSPMQKSTLIVYVRHFACVCVGTPNAEIMSTRSMCIMIYYANVYVYIFIMMYARHSHCIHYTQYTIYNNNTPNMDRVIVRSLRLIFLFIDIHADTRTDQQHVLFSYFNI